MSPGVLPVHRAIERATAAGGRAELLCSVVSDDLSFSVALTVHDDTPTVSIRLSHPSRRASEILLGEREQFGPDSWDYPVRIARPADRFVLRLTRLGASVDVPVLSAAAAVLLEHGWNATPGAATTAVIAEDAFGAALEVIACTETGGAMRTP